MRVFYMVSLLICLTACKNVRPDTALGPVNVRGHIVSSAIFQFGIVSDPYSDRNIFVRYVHYFVRPNQWTILSSGDTAPVTLFEEAAVYALRFVGADDRPAVTRLFKVPNVRAGGVTPPRIHLAVRAPGPTTLDRPDNPMGIVYFEDGPVYGGFDVGRDLDPRFNGDQDPRLLVDGRVRVAALASDGKTIAYVDVTGWLYVVTPGESPPTPLIDIRAAIGPVSVLAIQWDYFIFNKVWIRINRGTRDEIWTTSTAHPLLTQIYTPSPGLAEPGSELAAWIEDITVDLAPRDWGIPGPASFSLR